MAIQKQNINISFVQGIDTKTDPNQVVAGKLIAAQNVVFTETMAFNKRNGYQKLAQIDDGLALATFKNELVAFDGTTLQSYSPSTETTINKGNITSVDLQVSSVFKGPGAQTAQDSAFHPSGLYLYVFVTDGTAQYLVVSSETGNQVIPTTNIGANAIYSKAYALGNYLIITYVDTGTNSLRYIAIATATLEIFTAADISNLVDPTNRYYDAAILNDYLYISYNASDVGGAVRTTYLDQFLNQGPNNTQSSQQASNSILVTVDSTDLTVWVTYYDGSDIKYFVLNAISLSSVLTPTTIATLPNILNLTGYVDDGSGVLYYQTQNTYSYSSVRTDFISSVTYTSAGAVGTSSVFLRSVGIISKCFNYLGMQYFLVAYNGSLQPTYFLVNQLGVVVAKLAYTNGGGYGTNGLVTNVNAISDTEFQLSYLFKDLVTTQSGNVYTQTGVNSVVFDFESNNSYQSVDAGNNLNINGGFLWAYDGYSPVEQNFHLFPEDLGYTSSSASTGLFAGSYSYIALYEWTDNQGNTHRSGYGTPLSVVNSFATSGISVNVPTLRLTEKEAPRQPIITLYRTAPTIATGIYYKVSSVSNPTLSSTAIDSVKITDNLQDAVIVGNELLYTTGGVVQDSGGPPASGMTFFKNRLMLIDSENKDQEWYSKQVIQNTPVEMSDLFTQFIDPRFGPLTAIAVMDDKQILFKENAIFYQVGNGPDNTGANNDFSEAIFITSVVGCTNYRSIVLTPEGLMFKTNKGIWMLSRGLGISYIGAPVEDYNSFEVTSAELIPNSTQVRFTLSNKIVLVYDYYVQQWATFNNHNAADAIIFNDLYTYVTPNGTIVQETPNQYSDNGQPILMSLKTSWISMAGFQGFQRAYSLFLKAKFLSPHLLKVSIAYDFDVNATQSTIIDVSSKLLNTNYGSDPYWGSTQYWGGVSPQTEQYEISLDRQKCQAIQVTIEEVLDTSNPVFGPGLTLEALGLVIGVKSTYPRLQPSQRVS